MAAPEYYNGSKGRGFATPPGGNTAIEMDVNGWDMTVTGNNKDVSGAKSGRKRIPGVRDANGSCKLHYDGANKPTDTTANTGLNLRDGSVIALELVPDGSDAGTANSFRLSAIIDTVHPSSEFDGTVDFEVTFSLEDGSTFKYPGDT